MDDCRVESRSICGHSIRRAIRQLAAPGALRLNPVHLRRRRVPVALQLNATECGAACLAMVLSYYGRQTRVSEYREALGIGRDGATALTIARAARANGLRVKAYSLEPSDLRYIQCPAIVHWNFNHFVVVERWSPTRVDIVDPAVGRRRLTHEVFEAGFTGVTLTFEPGVHFERRAQVSQPIWRHYLGSVLRMPGVLAQIIGVSLLLQALGLALPLLTKTVVDQVLQFQLATLMPLLGIGMVLLALAQSIMT
jgi:ATP-binding cassette, subfamily B, bacterial